MNKPSTLSLIVALLLAAAAAAYQGPVYGKATLPDNVVGYYYTTIKYEAQTPGPWGSLFGYKRVETPIRDDQNEGDAAFLHIAQKDAMIAALKVQGYSPYETRP